MNKKTKSSNKKVNSKNAKITDLKQVHGKDESAQKRVPTTLDEILGESISIYTAQTHDEYATQLSDMNMTDLQAHAFRVGLVPTEDRKLLVDRLKTEFNKHASKFTGKVNAGKIQSVDQMSAEAMKILREGA
jgi:hypothetical protein